MTGWGISDLELHCPEFGNFLLSLTSLVLELRVDVFTGINLLTFFLVSFGG